MSKTQLVGEVNELEIRLHGVCRGGAWSCLCRQFGYVRCLLLAMEENLLVSDGSPLPFFPSKHGKNMYARLYKRRWENKMMATTAVSADQDATE